MKLQCKNCNSFASSLNVAFDDLTEPMDRGWMEQAEHAVCPRWQHKTAACAED